MVKKALYLYQQTSTITQTETEMTKHWLDYKLRILNSDGTILNANTDLNSWFSVNEARELCNYEIGQRIFRHNGERFCEEIFLGIA